MKNLKKAITTALLVLLIPVQALALTPPPPPPPPDLLSNTSMGLRAPVDGMEETVLGAIAPGGESCIKSGVIPLEQIGFSFSQWAKNNQFSAHVYTWEPGEITAREIGYFEGTSLSVGPVATGTLTTLVVHHPVEMEGTLYLNVVDPALCGTPQPQPVPQPVTGNTLTVSGNTVTFSWTDGTTPFAEKGSDVSTVTVLDVRPGQWGNIGSAAVVKNGNTYTATVTTTTTPACIRLSGDGGADDLGTQASSFTFTGVAPPAGPEGKMEVVGHPGACTTAAP